MQSLADVIVDTSKSPRALLRAPGVSAFQLSDAFWRPRQEVNRRVSIPGQYKLCEETGRLDNFRRAAGKDGFADKPFKGIFFNDSDVYKWLEAASWDLTTASGEQRAEIARLVEGVIAEIAAAQDRDGYIGTYFTHDHLADRLKDPDKHELYCGGHLIQAAVAHHRVTGADSLLSVAKKFADFMCNTIGPAEAGKTPFLDGHEEVEMALVELYRVTNEKRYLDLAQYFIDQRGQNTLGTREWTTRHFQDHIPFRQLNEATGHAVRAMYYAIGAADTLAESGDKTISHALYEQLDSMTERRSYVSGGIGSRWHGEAFGDDYELPNHAYAETCAAIGSVMWSWRMLLLDGNAAHADRMEWALYNAVLPGISLDGQQYFYQNPLEDDGTHRRKHWFGCACCPPNVSRLLAQLTGYFFGLGREGEVYVHQYAAGRANLPLSGGRSVQLSVRSRYPWHGEIELKLESGGTFPLLLRIPGWCESDVPVAINGVGVFEQGKPGTYMRIERTWKAGDSVRLHVPMPVRRLSAHPFVTNNAGRVALARGPVLYAIEAADHPGVDIRHIEIPDDASIEAHHKPDFLGGVTVLNIDAAVRRPTDSSLYRSGDDAAVEKTPLLAIPYNVWGHREAGPMQVWIRRG